jgi:hypothetical protein
MATFQITGPDGKKYRVSGENAEGALAALQQHIGAGQPQQEDPRDSVLGRVDAAMRGAADTLSLGFADEIAAGLGTGFGVLGNYDEELARQRGIDASDSEDRFGYRLGGQLAGGVGGGIGMARNGLSFGANAINRGASLGRVAAASAGEGALLGGAHGFGSGEGAAGRAGSALAGGVIGGGLGAVAPVAMAGLQRGLGMAAAPITARLFPESYAQRAIGEGVRRSGLSVDDIAAALSRSQADDQGMFTVADAMGNSGQRMLSTVARNPSDARQGVIEALQERQVGQGDRLSSFLAEGFGASDTAAQRAANLTAQRTASANANYGAAREGAGSVDPTKAIAAADDFLGMGGSLPRTNIADDSIESAVSRAKSYLTDGQSVISDFGSALRSKQEMDAMIEGASPAVQRQLIPIRNALDEALESASPAYANARNTFRQQSRAIDAIDTGRAASSGRMRSSDTVPQFNALSEAEQSAFRAGYADPLIARIEATSMSPTTNKARSLITPKTGEEFPAFAVPGNADQMGSRIAREQRMFETANAALGGSKTADNLADAAELAKFDPGVMSKLFRGDFIGAAMDGVRRVGSEASGTPPRVVEQIAEALMQTDPNIARQFLTASGKRMTQQEALRAQIVAALTGLTSAGAGRALAP